MAAASPPDDLPSRKAAAGFDPTATLSKVVGGIPAQTTDPSRRAFHAVDAMRVAKYWWSSTQEGISADEASKRAARLGKNKLAEKASPTLFQRLFKQVSDSTVLTLLGAAVIAAALKLIWPEEGLSFLGKFGDALAILLIVILNAILGVVNEQKAESALAALRDMTSPTARVVRGGAIVHVLSESLVPGDVVLLEEGDVVAADLRLATSADLEIEEAALTGESVPTSKDATIVLEPGAPLADRVNMAFMGTRVTRGKARGIVCNTGMHTELGSIAGMLADVEDEDTPLEQQLDKFGKLILIGCVAVSAVVFAAGWAFAGQSPQTMFLVAVSLAVAAIPEGLPAITTITLALGTTRMARRNALVRRLPAVETLGCAQVICTDKTGTLTQNAMTARRLWVGDKTYHVGGEGRDIAGSFTIDHGAVARASEDTDLALAMHAAAHSIGARVADAGGGKIEVHGDPTDAALLVMAWKGREQNHEGIVAAEVPFTSSRRMATVIADEGGRKMAFLRGAPEVLLGLSDKIRTGGGAKPLDEETRQRVMEVAGAWGKETMRVVALAVREHPPDDPDPSHWESSLTFVALVGIVDPPRPEVKAAIAEARRAGIRSVMITGDHPATARAIAEQLGLWEESDLVVTGSELDELDQQRLEAMIARVRIVARATAAHKLRIVEALKARGTICAMTGDGVNDAPAVKSAHIGIAMGKAGTEVTKEAADLVLADDNYATIVAAVEEGRSIYANIRKAIYFLLSSNAGIVLMVLAASLGGWAAPLTPIQILWINLITNGLPALALGVDPKDPDQMLRPPRAAGGQLMANREWLSMTMVGALMAVCALALFWWAVPGGGADLPHRGPELARARTLAFTFLAISPMFHSLNCRSETRSIFQLGLFGNVALWGAAAIGIGLQAMSLYIPALRPVFMTSALGGGDLLVVIALSSVPLVVVELAKIWIRLRAPAAAV